MTDGKLGFNENILRIHFYFLQSNYSCSISSDIFDCSLGGIKRSPDLSAERDLNLSTLIVITHSSFSLSILSLIAG